MQPSPVIFTDINLYPGMCLASIIVQQRNHAEDKLLLGCEDGTLVCEQNRMMLFKLCLIIWKLSLAV